MHRFKTFTFRLYGVYATVVSALCVAVSGALILLVPGVERRRRIARRGLRVTFLCAAMPFRVDGIDRLPDEPSIVIANHLSYLDGLVLIAALPPHFTPVIKAEIRDAPVIGRVLQRVGSRFVQREPAMRAGRDTKHLLDALKAGESLAVFPEGTFSVDDGLLPFRDGAFFLANKAGSPVVPLAIQGTRDVLPLGYILPCPAVVKVRVLDALRGDGAGRDAASVLRDQTENVLWHGLKPNAPDRPGRAPDYDYYCRVFYSRSLPLAYLDLDLLEYNIRTALDRSGEKQLRVDARALSCPAIIDRVLRSNIRFHGVKCATAHEAIYLARQWELDDMLVAYPTLRRDAIADVCQGIRDGWTITLTADCTAHVELLSDAAEHAGVTLPLCVEMDLSSRGISRRSPLRTTEALLALVDAIGMNEHLRFRGLLAFDTQRTNIPAWFTSPRGRWRLIRQMSNSAQRQMHQRRKEIVERLRASGYEPDIVNGGGAGGIEFNAADPGITEINVGSALFSPQFPDDDFEHVPAAGFATEVMRQPEDNRYACLGGGYIAADTLDPNSLPRPVLPWQAQLDDPEGAGEAHIPIRYTGELNPGDPVFLRSPNAGELCERFGYLLLVQDGAIVEDAPTYRMLGDRLL